jgi:hypothetical protein
MRRGTPYTPNHQAKLVSVRERELALASPAKPRVLSLNKTNKIKVLLFSLGAIGLGAIGLPRYFKRHAVDAMPATSLGVVTAETAALRLSPLAEPVRSILRTQFSLPATCDPLAAFSTVSATVPNSASVGFAIETTEAELRPCIGAESAASGAAPSGSRSVGSFTVSESERAMSTAVSRRGPLLITVGGSDARTSLLDHMVATAEKREANLVGGPHDTLRTLLRTNDATLVLTGTLVVTAALQRDLEAVVEANLGLGKPALAITKAGASVHLVNGNLELTAIIECADSQSCAAIRDQLMRLRLALSSKLALRLAGASPLLDNFTADSADTRITARTRDSQENVATLLGRWSEFAKFVK